MTTALEGGEGSTSRPGLYLPPEKSRYPLYKRLGGHQGRSEQARKILPPPGFDHRTVQPVASRYSDYDTRPTSMCMRLRYCNAVLHRKLLMHVREACSRNEVIQALTLLAACTEPTTKSLTFSGSCCLSVRLTFGKTTKVATIQRYS